MDFTDIGKVNMLSNEQKNIQRVLDIFAEGGRITQLGVSPPASSSDTLFAAASMMVTTDYIDYPPQMVDAIRSALETRQEQIAGELEKLGVTGVPQPPAR